MSQPLARLGTIQEQVAWAAITQLDSGESTKTPGTQDALALRVDTNGRFSKEVEASGPNLDLVRSGISHA